MEKNYIAALVFLTPFAIAILGGVLAGIKVLIREIDYALNGDKQIKLFNQLKKGDFIWHVYEDQLHYRFVKQIEYIFIGTKVKNIRIYFYGGYNHLNLEPDRAKTYRFGNYYTIKDEAKVEANHIKMKRQESIDSVKMTTSEDISKAANAVVNHVNNITKEYKKN